MKKLTLDLDALQVESFAATDARQAPPGTVFAAEDNMRTLPGYCITFTCGDSHIRPC
ncbi:MAG TPA: hypothetical protein VNP72_01665 [Longimicrobium sp.]|nr:hypothetical protein [Longimicrobium sp.]